MTNQKAIVENAANKKVVVADENTEVADKVAYRLRGEGYSVTTVTTGAEARTQINEKPPWLLVVSETLQDMAGHTLLLQLHQENTALPCILMLMNPYSGGGFGRWAEYGVAREMPHIHLNKPFNPVEFDNFVRLLRTQYEQTGSCCSE